MVELRDYQTKALELIDRAFSIGKRAPLVAAPTGSGKTVIAAELIRRTDGRCLFLAPRRELVYQTSQKLHDIGFSVSPERRRAVEDELLDEALAAFRDRAERVRKQLGAKGYAIATIQLGSSGGQPPRPMRGAVMMAESVAPPPPLEAGTSTLRATAHATIELGF